MRININKTLILTQSWQAEISDIQMLTQTPSALLSDVGRTSTSGPGLQDALSRYLLKAIGESTPMLMEGG